MTLFGGDEKDQARQIRDAWKQVSVDATFAGGVASAAVGAGATLVGLSTALFAGPLVVTAGMVWYASRTVLAAERVAEDPPRLDFDQVAVPRVIRLAPQDLVPSDSSYRDESFIRDAASAFNSIAALVGYGEAIVLTYERMAFIQVILNRWRDCGQSAMT